MKITEQLKMIFHRNPEVNYAQKRYIESYKALLERLSEIRRNFDFTDDEPAIEALIYEENATVCRLEHLIREAKSENIKIPPEDFLR